MQSEQAVVVNLRSRQKFTLSGLRIDHDSYCSIDDITADQITANNKREANKFLKRKVHGKSGIMHRVKQN